MSFSFNERFINGSSHYYNTWCLGVFCFVFALVLFFVLGCCGKGVQSMWSNVYSLKLFPSRKYKTNEPKHSQNTQFSTLIVLTCELGNLSTERSYYLTSSPLEPRAHAVVGSEVAR